MSSEPIDCCLEALKQYLPRPNPIADVLAAQDALILDGGLATELEVRGFDLTDELWSARLLLEDPDAIRRLHVDYLIVGADCITSASYQATVSGFVARGVGEAEAVGLLLSSVELALEARDEFWGRIENRKGRQRPLVAASIGPYGAYLADGSEYRGDYGLSEEQLVEFHGPRLAILADSGADLLACETIPSRIEAHALARILDKSDGIEAWMSFSCRDAKHLADGEELAATIAEIEGCRRIAAFGVNCVSPNHVSALVAEMQSVTSKPIAVYPNSGEIWDATAKSWHGPDGLSDIATHSRAWKDAGARLIGGCCRCGPNHIREIRSCVLNDA